MKSPAVFVKEAVVIVVHRFCGKIQPDFASSCDVTGRCRTPFWVSQSPARIDVSISIARPKWHQQNPTYTDWLEKWKTTRTENWTMTPVIFAEGISRRQNCVLESSHFLMAWQKQRQTGANRTVIYLYHLFIYFFFFSQSIFHTLLIVKLIEGSGWFLCFPLHVLRPWQKETL